MAVTMTPTPEARQERTPLVLSRRFILTQICKGLKLPAPVFQVTNRGDGGNGGDGSGSGFTARVWVQYTDGDGSTQERAMDSGDEGAAAAWGTADAAAEAAAARAVAFLQAAMNVEVDDYNYPKLVPAREAAREMEERLAEQVEADRAAERYLAAQLRGWRDTLDAVRRLEVAYLDGSRARSFAGGDEAKAQLAGRILARVAARLRELRERSAAKMREQFPEAAELLHD